MANLRTNNLSGEQGQNAIRGSVVFGSDQIQAGLKIEDNSELELGSETNWTIEFWIWLNGSTHGDYDVVLGKGSGTGNNYEYYVEIMADNTLDFLTTTAGTAWDFQQQISPVLQHDSWHHIAIVRNGSGSNSLKSYVNGQEYGSFTAQNIHTSSYPFGIGYYAGYHAGSGLYGNAILSNVRIVKGTSVYTAAFTPPFQELTAIPDTVLLCCQDSDNPLKEETGKTITGVGIYEHLNDTELVTNGSGTTTTGWTDANTSTFTVEDGMIKVTRSGGTGYTAYQTITTVDGQQYTVSVNIRYSSGNYADLRVVDGSGTSGTMLKFLRSTGTSTDGNKSTTFTAASSSTTLAFTFDDGGNTGYFSQISVKATDRGKFPKVIPPYGVDAGNAFGGPIQQSSQGYMYFPTGRTEERGRGRAVIFAGSVTPVSPNFSSNIDYIEMRSSGVGVRFGNCTGNSHHGSCGSSTRGFMFGGQIGSPDVQTNLIEFVTIATEGNSTDFGDLLRAKRRLNGQGHSNKTRAILAGGGGDAPLAPDNVIQFFTMASTGDATDFGDLNAAKDNSAGTGSPTRMLIAGGRDYTPSATVVNKIEYITMSTTGNVTDFGDLTVARAELARASNAVRSVFVSGGTPSPKVNTIDFVTTATTGDATDFGDLPIAKGGMASANNSIIGIFVAGTTGSRTTDIQSLTIATTGNGVAFGDCNVTDPSQGREGCSDSHGGLS